MDMSIVVGVAERLLKWLASSVFMEMGSGFEVSELKNTLSKINSSLVQAEAEAEAEAAEVWIEKLKEALYDADDLLDEFQTLMLQRQMKKCDEVNSSSNIFRPGFNYLSMLNMSRKLNKIGSKIDETRHHLDALVSKLGPISAESGATRRTCCTTPTARARGDSLSPLPPFEVYGREADKDNVIRALLLQQEQEQEQELEQCFVTVVGIVGMGGVGKTTLAQLVYNDDRITDHFSSKMWVSVSDQFDLRAIASKILAAGPIEIDPTQQLGDDYGDKLQIALQGKKYLLVLDDVWNDNVDDWRNLETLLSVGARGSRILVTSRSKAVATAITNCVVYELRALCDDDAWRLFKKAAFGDGPEQTHGDLLTIGKEILRKCANIPLAITTVGSLLKGRDKSKWLMFKNTDFANIREFDDSLMSILELSYHHLPPHLKSCFAYCSMFPKDHVIQKETLINLWMAQGFILPDEGAQTLVDTAEEYFTALLQRYLFEVVKQDEYGEVVLCKIHDLMHDVAHKCAADELLGPSSITANVSKQIRHLSVGEVKNDSILTACFNKSKIRTFLNFWYPTTINQSSIDKMLFSGGRCLRVLALNHLNIISLPSAIGNLVHLRYLDLSSNSMIEVLPSSITKLRNLQTLNLSYCSQLKVLPESIEGLVQLRHLYIGGCNNLNHMPPGMGKMTSLCRLTMFVVGGETCAFVSKQLDDLKALRNLEGSVTVRVRNAMQFDAGKVREAGYLRAKQHLMGVCIQWKKDDKVVNEREDGEYDAALLEGLEPHMNCRSFKLTGYPGARFPSWALFQNLATYSPVLDTICLEHCPGLQHLPPLGQLPHLRVLTIHKLVKLEYVEDNCGGYVDSVSGSGASGSSMFFPSLKMLTLSNLSELKGWWRGMETSQGSGTGNELVDRVNGQLVLPFFPPLSLLKIQECPKLTSLPLCTNAEELDMYRFNDALPSIFPSPKALQQQLILRRVSIDNVVYLSSLPAESYLHLSLVLIHLSELHSLSATKGVFLSPMSSLESLQISSCSKLKGLSGLGWKHLIALKKLSLSNLPALDLTIIKADGEEDGMPWKSLRNLCALELDYLPKLVNLPDGVQGLTNLESLEIRSCHNLIALPEWIDCLIHLKFLYLEDCIGLECLPESIHNLTLLSRLEVLRCSGFLRERCQAPEGVDWPKIQHIRHISIQ